MKHEDFTTQYMHIRDKEVDTLNTAIASHFNGEYHFNDDIYVEATMPNTSTQVQAKLFEVKVPVTSNCGLFVRPEDYVDDDYIEIGYLNIGYGDIDYILDNLPEPMKNYSFRWDGGDLPKRHEAFAFQRDADAMKSAREFLQVHHIDIINVFEGEGNETRRVVSYTK